jgi:hypothetical protein
MHALSSHHVGTESCGPETDPSDEVVSGVDMITIEWLIKKGMGVSAVPAVGRVRFDLPTVWVDGDAIYGDPALTAWHELDVLGAGSVTLPDPRAVAQLPSGATIRVEVDTDAWVASSFALCVPEGPETAFTLQQLMGWGGGA